MIDNPEWNAWIESVRAAAQTKIAEIIRPHVPEGWHATGPGEYRGKSPLRAATSDTGFSVSANKGAWFDFGLGEGGDAISFLRRRFSLNFRDAVDMAAREAGLPSWEDMKRSRGMAVSDPLSLLDAWANNEAAQRVREIMTALVEMFHAALPEQVRVYLVTHYQLTEETIAREKIGWAFSGAFEHALATLPFTREELLSSGFFVERKNDVATAQAERILFPYWKDGLVAYSIGRHYFGRASSSDATLPEWDRGKYKKHLTCSDKFPYVSRHISNELLWGEDNIARVGHDVRRSTSALMTEGITDALMLQQLGLVVISPVTTTTSAKQSERARRLVKGFAELVIVNDNDEGADGSRPGDKGAVRTARILWVDTRVRIAQLPKPPGVAKVDVNELLGNWRREGADDAEVRARFVHEVVEPALSLPEAIVASWPSTITGTELEKQLVEVGALTLGMSGFQRADLLERILVRFSKRGRGPVKQALERGAREESARREARGETAVPDRGEKPKRDPSAAARLRSEVFDELGSYERVLADGGRERISDFSLTATRRVLSTDPFTPDRLEMDVVGAGGEALVKGWIPDVRAWSSKRNFVASLPSLRMHWYGTDEEVQAVHELLVARGVGHLPSLASTKVLGYHEVAGEPRFVTLAGTLDRGGWMVAPDIVYVPEGSCTVITRLPKERSPLDETTVAIARRALVALPLLQAPAAMMLCAAWFAAAAHRPFLLGELGGFPVLDLSASPGAGKTSLLAHILWPIFGGVMPGELLAAATTLFASLKDLASTNAIPLPRDEFKPHEMRKEQLDGERRFVRRIWSGEVETRGRADQSVSTYVLSAPLAIIGESGFDDDAATSERCAHVSFDRNWIGSRADVRALFAETRALDLWKVGQLYQHWTLVADRTALLAAARGEVDAWLESIGRSADIAPRTRVVLVTLAFGYLAIMAFAARCGVAAEVSAAAAPLTVVLYTALSNALGVDAQGQLGRAVADHVDRFMVDAAHMATAGVIRDGEHYAWLQGKLFLWVRGIEAAREAWIRARGAAFTSPGINALKKLAREQLDREGAYIVAVDHRAYLDDDRHARGWLVDAKRIPASLEIDDFPAAAARGWGGPREGAGRPPSPQATDMGRPWDIASHRAGRRRGSGGDEGPN